MKFTPQKFPNQKVSRDEILKLWKSYTSKFPSGKKLTVPEFARTHPEIQISVRQLRNLISGKSQAPQTRPIPQPKDGELPEADPSETKVKQEPSLPEETRPSEASQSAPSRLKTWLGVKIRKTPSPRDKMTLQILSEQISRVLEGDGVFFEPGISYQFAMNQFFSAHTIDMSRAQFRRWLRKLLEEQVPKYKEDPKALTWFDWLESSTLRGFEQMKKRTSGTVSPPCVGPVSD